MPGDTLRFLGICRKAGKLEIGEDPVGAACGKGRARLVLLASDAAENTRRRTLQRSRDGTAVTVPYTKEQLGAALGRGSCAVLAITDTGLAAAIHKTLAASDDQAGGVRKCNPTKRGGYRDDDE